MAVINRTKDATEQRWPLHNYFGAVATGVTGVIAHIPWPCVLESGQVAAFGLSGAPNYTATSKLLGPASNGSSNVPRRPPIPALARFGW